MTTEPGPSDSPILSARSVDIEYMKSVVAKIDSIKDDTTIYSLIFHFLTKNDTVKNYSVNSNGVFFNINTMEENDICKVDEIRDTDFRVKEDNKRLEEQRSIEIREMQQSVKNHLMNDIKSFISDP